MPSRRLASDAELVHAIAQRRASAAEACRGVLRPPITPLACVVVKPGATVTTAHIDDHLGKRFAKWWVPDAMVFMDAMPKTSVGKFDKKAWREPFKDVQLATAAGDEDRSSGRFQA